jgi:large subunit ribosomal protein L21
MYAVIRSGGKQYRVSPGGSVRVEKLPGEVGSPVTLEDVLIVGPDASEEGEVKIGAPNVDGARVTGTITAQGRGPKLTVFKMKRRKGYRRKRGHRQDYTEIRVDQIEGI